MAWLLLQQTRFRPSPRIYTIYEKRMRVENAHLLINPVSKVKCSVEGLLSFDKAFEGVDVKFATMLILQICPASAKTSEICSEFTVWEVKECLIAICRESLAVCYGSVKMIRFSYSNEDTKDEEGKEPRQRGELHLCTRCQARNHANPKEEISVSWVSVRKWTNWPWSEAAPQHRFIVRHHYSVQVTN
jgi:hypothetical protein